MGYRPEPAPVIWNSDTATQQTDDIAADGKVTVIAGPDTGAADTYYLGSNSYSVTFSSAAQVNTVFVISGSAAAPSTWDITKGGIIFGDKAGSRTNWTMAVAPGTRLYVHNMGTSAGALNLTIHYNKLG